MSARDDVLQRFVVDGDTLVANRLFDGNSCGRLGQRADHWEIEQALGVRFRTAHLSTELR